MHGLQIEETPQHQDQKPIEKVLNELRIIKLELDEIRKVIYFIKHQVEVPDFMKLEDEEPLENEPEPETKIQDIGWRLW